MKQYIHVSDIQAFLQCRRAWNWSSNLRQHLTTIEPYKPFYLGTVIHKFLEEYYHPNKFNGHASERARAYLSAQPNVIPEFIEFGVNIFEHYLQWVNVWDTSPLDPLGDYRLISQNVEQEFDVPILSPSGKPSSKFRFAGRVDGVWRSQIDGKLYLHEIKTTSSIDHRIAQLQFEMQPTAYILAMEQVYNEPVVGVIYTLIRKKVPVDPDVLQNGTLSKNKAIDTTVDNYLACIKRRHPSWETHEIKAVYGDILNHLLSIPNKFFRRVLITRSQTQLDEMHQTLYQVARDMTNKHLPLYPNPGYFCSNCLYQQPCIALSNGQPIDPILTQYYTHNTRLDGGD